MPSSSSSKSTIYGKHSSGSTSTLAVGGAGASSSGGHGLSGSSSRQMARLGVQTDYVDLSLHSACANGNSGEFASQFDGVLTTWRQFLMIEGKR